MNKWLTYANVSVMAYPLPHHMVRIIHSFELGLLKNIRLKKISSMADAPWKKRSLFLHSWKPLRKDNAYHRLLSQGLWEKTEIIFELAENFNQKTKPTIDFLEKF